VTPRVCGRWLLVWLLESLSERAKRGCKVDIDGSAICIHRQSEDGFHKVEGLLPAVIGVVEKINEPRYPSFAKPAAVWAGGGAVDGQPRLAEFGAAKVYVADGDGFTDYVTAPKAELLAHLAAEKSPAAVPIASTRHNKEVAGRLAVKTNSGLLADAVGLTAQYGKIVAEQSVFGGATIVHSAVKRGTPVITVRPNSAAHEPASAAPDIEHVDIEVRESAKGASELARRPDQAGRLKLDQGHARRPVWSAHRDFRPSGQ
jgi:electron transfer flavoprotein alpha subunit